MNEFPWKHLFHRQVQDPDEGACQWEANQQVGSNYHSYAMGAYTEDWVEKQVHHQYQVRELENLEEDPKVGVVGHVAHSGLVEHLAFASEVLVQEKKIIIHKMNGNKIDP